MVHPDPIRFKQPMRMVYPDPIRLKQPIRMVPLRVDLYMLFVYIPLRTGDCFFYVYHGLLAVE